MVRSSTEAQGALFEKEDFYREIVENANSIILRMDIKGSLKFMNRYGQSFFGYQEDELIGRNVMDTIVPNKILLKRDLTALLVDFEKDHEKYIYNEFENMRKGGQRVSIAWTNKAVFNTKNKLKEIISIGNDITQRVQAERALKVSEANYRSIYNAVSDAILVQASMTGEILDANQGACEMFKCEIKDLLGAHIYKFNSSADCYTKEEIDDRIRRARDNGQQLFEWLARDARGKMFWVEVNLKHGIINARDCVIAIIRDITVRKEAERELKERELQYTSIFNSAIDGIVITDQDDNIVEVNPAVCRMHGYKRAEFLKLNARDIVHPGCQHLIEKLRDDITKHDYYKAESVDLRKDGSPINVELRCTPFNYRGSKHILTIKRDITERKQFERALQTSEKRYKTLYESSQDAIMLLTPEGKFLEGNPATLRIFGCENFHQFTGEFAFGFSPDKQPDGSDSKNKAKEMIEKALKEGYHLFEWKHRRLDQTEFYSIVQLTRMELEGRVILQATVRDITEKKRAEQTQGEYVTLLRNLSSKLIYAQEAEKKRIARELHDGIGQMLTTIKLGLESSVQQDSRDNVIDSLSKLVPITQDALDEIRKASTGLRPLMLDDLGIVPAIKWYSRRFTNLYPTFRIESDISVDEATIPESVKINIFRIIQEALSNIAKYSRADSVCISLLEQDDELSLEISDNGKGFNLDEVSKEGFGIINMQERAELTGGTFVLESVPKAGTTIKAVWPLDSQQKSKEHEAGH